MGKLVAFFFCLFFFTDLCTVENFQETILNISFIYIQTKTKLVLNEFVLLHKIDLRIWTVDLRVIFPSHIGMLFYLGKWLSMSQNPTWCLKMSGESWECSSPKAGFTTWGMNQVHEQNNLLYLAPLLNCKNLTFKIGVETDYTVTKLVLVFVNFLLFFSEPHILLFRRPLSKHWPSPTISRWEGVSYLYIFA